jgi:hypothetical protein
MIWFLVILIGSVIDAYFAILMTMAIELRGIGPSYAGTAMGIIFSFGNLGNFLASPSGNRLAVIHPQYAFFFWACLMFTASLFSYFSRETKKIKTANR